jgi:REP element-mobilizing transposase RayT
MPDHAHLLIGVGSGADLCRLVGSWKSRCFLARRVAGNSTRFWQRSFYDHAIRGDEDLLAAARYVLENPVRAGLVKDYREYPLTGSFEFDL